MASQQLIPLLLLLLRPRMITRKEVVPSRSNQQQKIPTISRPHRRPSRPHRRRRRRHRPQPHRRLILIPRVREED